MIDYTLVNGRANKEFYNGKLVKQGERGLVKTQFKYSIVTGRDYAVATSAMPFEFIQPTETIRTSAVDLPFAKNDKVELYDGRMMTVKSISVEESPERYFMSGNGRTSLTIALEGGGNV